MWNCMRRPGVRLDVYYNEQLHAAIRYNILLHRYIVFIVYFLLIAARGQVGLGVQALLTAIGLFLVQDCYVK